MWCSELGTEWGKNQYYFEIKLLGGNGINVLWFWSNLSVRFLSFVSRICWWHVNGQKNWWKIFVCYASDFNVGIIRHCDVNFLDYYFGTVYSSL